MDGHQRASYGGVGEAAAERFLVERGMRLVARDVRLRQGQIDLVMLDGDCMVVVEVKARSGRGFGLAQEAVGWKKLRKLRELTELFHQLNPGVGRQRRIDVVAVELDRAGRAGRCEHIPNVLM